jgi:hypothetical protein
MLRSCSHDEQLALAEAVAALIFLTYLFRKSRPSLPKV